MSIDPKRFTQAALQRQCGPSAFQRGERYFQQGRTTIEYVEEQLNGRLACERGQAGGGSRSLIARAKPPVA